METVQRAAERLLPDDLAGERLTVVWHAGEPLVMPPAFFEEAFAVIRESLPHCSISHSIQTNATLIDDTWCALFKQYDVRLGVSVDGPADLHDLHRRTRNGQGTHKLVLRGIAALQANEIPFHAIAVVTDSTLSQADAFFDFFLEHRICDIGCNFDEAEGTHPTSSIAGKDAAHALFIDRLLERSAQANGRVRVRELANAFRLIASDMPVYRWRGQVMPDNSQVIPFALISVAANGDFTTFSPELLGQRSNLYGDFALGNVLREGYYAAARSELFERLWGAVIRGTQACQDTCPYFGYCGGGSPANKLYENGDIATAETLYCRTMVKRPLDAVLKRLEQVEWT